MDQHNLNEEEKKKMEKLASYMASRGFTIPKNGKFQLNACSCSTCEQPTPAGKSTINTDTNISTDTDTNNN